MENKFQERRRECLEWWHSLDDIEQQGYFLDYSTSKFTPARNLSQLTGREIEIIYNNYMEEHS